MQRAAIGIRAHSGWAAVVAVSGEPGAVQVIDRSRVVVTDPQTRGANQPYHFVEDFELREAEKHLASCAAVAERLALAAFSQLLQKIGSLDYRVAGAAILLASGRPLPALARILASHALIHTAEGEFFRDAFRHACERSGIRVTGIRERDLEEHAAQRFGSAAPQLQRTIASLGKSLGPPWTQDQKTAALAGMIVLS